MNKNHTEFFTCDKFNSAITDSHKPQNCNKPSWVLTPLKRDPRPRRERRTMLKVIAFPNLQHRWTGKTACLIGGQGLVG
ncbi:hypothetical protein BANT918_00472 [Brevibacterium antiquum CNRZ 918]|uniref:Uncharacterized protein n=1 Tax=Brevibacterium antiquum CNRZ 918 TaxID=1255637 RepID=A0A2H1HTQ7_9MICO|nr:hypothetical protein BANT918_00472 [Brevibacterium antiquum CNRZ 918]